MKTKSEYKDNEVIYDLLVSDVRLIAKEEFDIDLTDEQISDIERAFNKADLSEDLRCVIEYGLGL